MKAPASWPAMPRGPSASNHAWISPRRLKERAFLSMILSLALVQEGRESEIVRPARGPLERRVNDRYELGERAGIVDHVHRGPRDKGRAQGDSDQGELVVSSRISRLLAQAPAIHAQYSLPL
jgi:hypothetical protein